MILSEKFYVIAWGEQKQFLCLYSKKFDVPYDTQKNNDNIQSDKNDVKMIYWHFLPCVCVTVA